MKYLTLLVLLLLAIPATAQTQPWPCTNAARMRLSRLHEHSSGGRIHTAEVFQAMRYDQLVTVANEANARFYQLWAKSIAPDKTSQKRLRLPRNF